MTMPPRDRINGVKHGGVICSGFTDARDGDPENPDAELEEEVDAMLLGIQ
jgi:hypothetical protein